MDQNQNPNNQLNIELSEEVAEGIYSNLAIITHSNSEFVVDFVKVMPGVPKAKVKARILLTPQHAKRLLAALQDNVQKFEAAHGTIKQTEGFGIPMNFGGPAAFGSGPAPIRKSQQQLTPAPAAQRSRTRSSNSPPMASPSLRYNWC